jgi:hypothetical protein
MAFFSEDITFCGNKECSNMECFRNPKHIKLSIPHSFALFDQCEYWDAKSAKWLINQFGNFNDENRK